MPVELKLQTPNGTSISNMKDGELGVLVHFPSQSSVTGLIVQRYQDRLIAVGKSAEYSWPNFFDLSTQTLQDYLYKPLEHGDIVEVRND